MEGVVTKYKGLTSYVGLKGRGKRSGVGLVEARSTINDILYRSVARVVPKIIGSTIFHGNRMIARRSIPMLLSMKGRRLCM